MVVKAIQIVKRIELVGYIICLLWSLLAVGKGELSYSFAD